MEYSTFHNTFREVYIRNQIFSNVKWCNRVQVRSFQDPVSIPPIHNRCLSFTSISSIGWMVKNNYISLLKYKLAHFKETLDNNPTQQDQKIICTSNQIDFDLFKEIYMFYLNSNDQLENNNNNKLLYFNGKNPVLWSTLSGDIQRYIYLLERNQLEDPTEELLMIALHGDPNNSLLFTAILNVILERTISQLPSSAPSLSSLIELNQPLHNQIVELYKKRKSPFHLSLEVILRVLIKAKKYDYIERVLLKVASPPTFNYQLQQLCLVVDQEFIEKVKRNNDIYSYRDISPLPKFPFQKEFKNRLYMELGKCNNRGDIEKIVQKVKCQLELAYQIVRLNHQNPDSLKHWVSQRMNQEKEVVQQIKVNQQLENKSNLVVLLDLIKPIMMELLFLSVTQDALEVEFIEFLVESYSSIEFVDLMGGYLNVDHKSQAYKIFTRVGSLQVVQHLLESELYRKERKIILCQPKSIQLYECIKQKEDAKLQDLSLLYTGLQTNSLELVEYWISLPSSLPPLLSLLPTSCQYGDIVLILTDIYRWGANLLDSHPLLLNRILIRLSDGKYQLNALWSTNHITTEVIHMILRYYMTTPLLQLNHLYNKGLGAMYRSNVELAACYYGRLDIISHIHSVMDSKYQLPTLDLINGEHWDILSIIYKRSKDIGMDMNWEFQLATNTMNSKLLKWIVDNCSDQSTRNQLQEYFTPKRISQWIGPDSLNSNKLDVLLFIFSTSFKQTTGIDLVDKYPARFKTRVLDLFKNKSLTYQQLVTALEQLPVQLFTPKEVSFRNWIPSTIKRIYQLTFKSRKLTRSHIQHLMELIITIYIKINNTKIQKANSQSILLKKLETSLNGFYYHIK